MRIQTNVGALNAHRNMAINGENASRNMQRLSSGFRINSAKDDAAGLAIANKLGADVRALQQASRNASQATAMLQVADGAAQTVGDILTRMKELVTQANSSNTGTQRDKIQDEFTALQQEIDRIASTTQYQGTSLVNGSFGGTVSSSSTVLTAANTGISDVKINGTKAGTYTIDNSATDGNQVTLSDGNGNSQTITATAGRGSMVFSQFGITLETTADFTISNGSSTAGSADTRTVVVTATTAANFQVSSSGSYGLNDLVSVNSIDLRATESTGLNLAAGGLTLGTVIESGTDANRQTLLTNIDTAINHVQTKLGEIGAAMNRIDYAKQNTDVLVQNTQAAESVIRDADMAFEMMEFTKNNILQQAAQAMLAQANQQPQGILQLLR